MTKKTASLSFLWQLIGAIFNQLYILSLSRSLGLQLFGQYVSIEIVCSLLMMFGSWGLSLGTSRYIAGNKLNEHELSSLTTSIVTLQTVIILTLLFLLNRVIKKFIGCSDIYSLVLIFSLIMSRLIQCEWLAVGIGKKYASNMYVAYSKIGCAIIVGCWIFTGQDVSISRILIVQSISWYVGAFLFLKSTKIKFRLEIPKLSLAITRFRKDTNAFIPNILQVSSTQLLSILIKLSFGNSALGMFSIYERTCNLVFGLFSPISSQLYPSFCKSYDKSRNALVITSWIQHFKTSLLFLVSSAACFTAIIIAPSLIIQLFSGSSASINDRFLLGLSIYGIASLLRFVQLNVINFVIYPSMKDSLASKAVAIDSITTAILLFSAYAVGRLSVLSMSSLYLLATFLSIIYMVYCINTQIKFV